MRIFNIEITPSWKRDPHTAIINGAAEEKCRPPSNVFFRRCGEAGYIVEQRKTPVADDARWLYFCAFASFSTKRAYRETPDLSDFPNNVF
ncbi:hypothetical protein AWN88_06110 [Agrobacterium tumefaciens]|nr:hypothetical protein AWN88_06110 [Agrobacterium tumefaciens]